MILAWFVEVDANCCSALFCGIGNLPFKVTIEQIQEHFSACGMLVILGVNVCHRIERLTLRHTCHRRKTYDPTSYSQTQT